MPLLYSEQLLFLHIPKTAGTSVAAFLARALPKPVWYHHVQPQPELALDGVAWVRGNPHPNAAQAARAVAAHGFALDRFPLILAVMRNPYELEVSQYEYLRARPVGGRSPRQQLARTLPFSDYLRVTLGEGAGGQPRSLWRMVAVGGRIPDNLRLVSFDRVEDGVRACLRDLGVAGVDAIAFPWLNRTDYGDWRSYYTAETEALVYASERWLFDGGLFERLRLDAGTGGRGAEPAAAGADGSAGARVLRGVGRAGGPDPLAGDGEARDGAGPPSGPAQVHRVSLARVALNPHLGPYRTPKRPPFARQPRFEAQFDFATLLYDVFWDVAGRQVLALGPPWPAGGAPGQGLRIAALPSGTPCAAADLFDPPGASIPLGLRLDVPAGTTGLHLSLGRQSWAVAVQPNLAAELAGATALVTVSRDNDLTWIRDWAAFHAAVCGVDAVVLYDNGSTAYGPNDLERALVGVPGLRHVVVVEQPAPYGPEVDFARGGGDRPQFLQRAMLEHARRRLLAEARWILNLDVDELLLLGDGVRLDDLAGDAGCVLVERRPVLSAQPPGAGPRRHRDFWQTPREPRPQQPKWLARPRACPPGARFAIHEITGAQAARADPAQARIAHFVPITTGWKRAASGKGWRTGAGRDLVPDEVLARALERVFGDEPAEVPPPGPRAGDAPDLLVRAAWLAAERGDLDGAATLAEAAIAADPAHLGGWQALLAAAERRDEDAAERARARIGALTEGSAEAAAARARTFLARGRRERAQEAVADAFVRGLVSPTLVALGRQLGLRPPPQHRRSAADDGGR